MRAKGNSVSEAAMRSGDETVSSGNVEQLHGGVGALLASARERLGESLPDTAKILRINWSYIEAIEESRFEKLPGRAYSVGFVRAYAEHLGLDADEIVRRFKMESGGVQKGPELIFPEPIPESRKPGAAVLMTGLLVIGVGWAGWQMMADHSGGDLQAVAPPSKSFTESADTSASAASAAPEPQASVVAPVFAPAPAPVPVAAVEAAPAPAPVPAQPELVQTAAVAAPAVAPAPAPEATSAPAPVQPAPVQTAAVSDDAGIVLRAKAVSWIQIRDSSTGQTIITQVMRDGDEITVPDMSGLVLLTGNAGALDVVVDGVTAPAIGGSGEILRNVLLQRDRLLAGTAAP